VLPRRKERCWHLRSFFKVRHSKTCRGEQGPSVGGGPWDVHRQTKIQGRGTGRRFGILDGDKHPPESGKTCRRADAALARTGTRNRHQRQTPRRLQVQEDLLHGKSIGAGENKGPGGEGWGKNLVKVSGNGTQWSSGKNHPKDRKTRRRPGLLGRLFRLFVEILDCGGL